MQINKYSKGQQYIPSHVIVGRIQAIVIRFGKSSQLVERHSDFGIPNESQVVEPDGQFLISGDIQIEKISR